MKFRFRISVIELLGTLTLAALACFVLMNNSEFFKYFFVSCEVLILAVAIAFIPSATGSAWRFLAAFAATAVMYQLFAFGGYYSPFEYLMAYGWLFLAQFGPNPPTAEALNGPRPDTLIAFRDTARPILGLGLAVLSGFLARSLEPTGESNH